MTRNRVEQSRAPREQVSLGSGPSLWSSDENVAGGGLGLGMRGSQGSDRLGGVIGADGNG